MKLSSLRPIYRRVSSLR